jgi:hypothetical protein
MAAKLVNSVALKGEFTLDTMEVVETTKEAINTYDFLEILRNFDGKTISISIKEENEITPKEEN